ncbi:S24/S26 family peptidase [Curtobacterium sp. ME26]|uniref:S24/S26 family peptidase n=1 Tax=Curtobacterium sp. ME26 TaxID=2744254 RepID=UPI0015F4CF1F|nr:S24/S26 family peptidase [Curtobacterium sp. ME26]
MVAIAVRGGAAPHDGLHDAVDWARVVVATAARAVLAALVGLAVWSAAPALLGWHPTTVMTGSMAPRLLPGDVVVSRPVAPAEVRPGQVLLADDPDHPGRLRMHRFVEPGGDGTVVTKGDANPRADSTPIERSAVHGVAALRVPFVASPVLWVREGRWVETGVLTLVVVALLALATVDGALRRPAAHRAARRAGHAGPVADAAVTGREARGDPDVGPPSGAGPDPSRRSLRAVARRGSGAHRAGAVVLVALAAGGSVVLPAGRADAGPFGRATATDLRLTAAVVAPATSPTCADASGSVVIAWQYAGDDPRSFTLSDDTGAVLATTDGRARSATVRLSSLLALGTTRAVRVQATDASSWTAVPSAPVSVRYSSLAGIGLGDGTSCVR